MKKVKVRKWIKPYLRKNNKRCKKKFSRVKGHYTHIEISTETTGRKDGE